jgi:hypothetical protein
VALAFNLIIQVLLGEKSRTAASIDWFVFSAIQALSSGSETP